MPATLMGRPHVFERGDKLYLTTPLLLASPSTEQIEEFAFASAVKSKAPNDNIGWLQGRYVEAARPNLNGAMWLTDELAVKSLTPMLMPVTVMHDPRTAVGCIADCQFVEENSSARIDDILAIWRHRFASVWEEATANIEQGQMMQSMECFSPWYTCAECEQSYVKLPQGAEKASWCSHLQGEHGRRILRDVCFTGTGLIFGSRGGVGAYTEAYLDHFQDEVAEYHERARTDSAYRPTHRSPSQMSKIEIEESDLAALRAERKEALEKVDALKDENRTLLTKVETAEVAQKRAEDEKAAAERKVTEAEEKAQRASRRDTRMSALGAGFLAALGETSKARLSELAGTCSDEQWNVELAEREEIAKVRRDAAKAGTPELNGTGTGTASTAGTGFASEEVANFLGKTTQVATSTPVDGSSAVRSLARSFNKRRQPAKA